MASRSLGACLVALALTGFPSARLRADTTFDSGTTTISTGTNFGTNLYVGYSGTATMELVAGGSGTSTAGHVGYNAGSHGVVVASGGEWTSAYAYYGLFGVGELIVAGGRISGIDTDLGSTRGSVGMATIVSGTWTNSDNLVVGSAGTGVVAMQGGYVDAGRYAHIGYAAGGVGIATITGGTCIARRVHVGDSGTGTLFVDGGHLVDTGATIALAATSVGVATITSGTWSSSGSLYVGADGSGTLNVNGGYVSCLDGYIGASVRGIGVATVTAGTWANRGGLSVGSNGRGTLNVLGTGVVTVSGTLSEGALGAITMTSGGHVTAGHVSLANTTSFTGDPNGVGFGTITATAGLTYGGVLGLHFGRVYEGIFNLFSFTGLTPSGTFSTLLSTGTGGGAVYDGIPFTNDGAGLWVGSATNGQTVSFNENSGVLSFSAVPEPAAAVLAGLGVLVASMAVRRPSRRSLPAADASMRRGREAGQ